MSNRILSPEEVHVYKICVFEPGYEATDYHTLDYDNVGELLSLLKSEGTLSFREEVEENIVDLKRQMEQLTKKFDAILMHLASRSIAAKEFEELEQVAKNIQAEKGGNDRE